MSTQWCTGLSLHGILTHKHSNKTKPVIPQDICWVRYSINILSNKSLAFKNANVAGLEWVTPSQSGKCWWSKQKTLSSGSPPASSITHNLTLRDKTPANAFCDKYQSGCGLCLFCKGNNWSRAVIISFCLMNCWEYGEHFQVSVKVWEEKENQQLRLSVSSKLKNWFVMHFTDCKIWIKWDFNAAWPPAAGCQWVSLLADGKTFFK